MRKIAKWEPQPDGSIVWCTDERVLGRVHADDRGLWRRQWFGEHGASNWELFPDSYGQLHRNWVNHPVWARPLRDEFPSAYDACLACEKSWPPTDRYFPEWFQSVPGGFFRQFAKIGRVYVRQHQHGWYAVRPDGRVLGKVGNVAWFSNHLDAMAAVEQEMHMPVDADPFRDKSDDWGWIRVKRPARAA